MFQNQRDESQHMGATQGAAHMAGVLDRVVYNAARKGDGLYLIAAIVLAWAMMGVVVETLSFLKASDIKKQKADEQVEVLSRKNAAKQKQIAFEKNHTKRTLTLTSRNHQ